MHRPNHSFLDLLVSSWKIKAYAIGVKSSLPKIIERDWSDLFPLHSPREKIRTRIVFKKSDKIWVRFEIVSKDESSNSSAKWPNFILDGTNEKELVSKAINSQIEDSGKIKAESAGTFKLIIINTQTEFDLLIILNPHQELVTSFLCDKSELIQETKACLTWFSELFPGESLTQSEIDETAINWTRIEAKQKRFNQFKTQIPSVSFILRVSTWVFAFTFLLIFLTLENQKRTLNDELSTLQLELSKSKKSMGLTGVSTASLSKITGSIERSNNRLSLLSSLSKNLPNGTILNGINFNETYSEYILESSTREGLFSIQDKLKESTQTLVFGNLEKRIDNGREFYRLPFKYTY